MGCCSSYKNSRASLWLCVWVTCLAPFLVRHRAVRASLYHVLAPHIYMKSFINASSFINPSSRYTGVGSLSGLAQRSTGHHTTSVMEAAPLGAHTSGLRTCEDGCVPDLNELSMRCGEEGRRGVRPGRQVGMLQNVSSRTYACGIPGFICTGLTH